MARPLQNGLLYFSFDVDFFGDKKIKILKGRYGSDGVMVYIYLLCEIYKNGYYVVLDEDMILCISDDLSLSEASTRQIISFLLSRSLLHKISDSTLAKSDTVLTATSIQRRYQEAKKGSKRDIAVKTEYWLLKESETLGFIKVRSEKEMSENYDDNSEKNSDKPKKNNTKKSKEKESKVYMSDGSECRLKNLSQEQYDILAAMSDERSVDRYIDKVVEWQRSSHKTCKEPFKTISKWISEDKKSGKQVRETSYDLDDYEEFALNYDLSEVLNKDDKL